MGWLDELFGNNGMPRSSGGLTPSRPGHVVPAKTLPDDIVIPKPKTVRAQPTSTAPVKRQRGRPRKAPKP